MNSATARGVLSVHGIKTRGVWQREITPLLNINKFNSAPLDLGYVLAVQFLWPWYRARKVKRFRSLYNEACVSLECTRPSLIAHSFGTYVAAEAMLKHREMKFDRIILCGAIVNVDFPWDKLVENGQVNAILNQYGGQDFWAGIVAWLVSDAGPSGRKGFNVVHPCLEQQGNPRFQHSDYFYLDNYKDNWLTFLRGLPVPQPVPIPPLPTNWRFIATMLSCALVLAFVVFKFTPDLWMNSFEGVWQTEQFEMIGADSTELKGKTTSVTVDMDQLAKLSLPVRTSLRNFKAALVIEYPDTQGKQQPCWQFGSAEKYYRFCYTEPSEVPGSFTACFHSSGTSCSSITAISAVEPWQLEQFEPGSHLRVDARIKPPEFEFDIKMEYPPPPAGVSPKWMNTVTAKWKDERIGRGDLFFSTLNGRQSKFMIESLNGEK